MLPPSLMLLSLLSLPEAAAAGRVSMFYASCPSACPMLIEDIRSLEAQLTPSERAALWGLLVSLDPVTDTPEVLTSVIACHGLDASRWRLVSSSPDQVRDIAAVLGISYQSIEDGELHHSSLVTLLSPDGRLLQRVEGLRQSPGPLLAALRGQ
ncbi:MAG: protein SCO1/2 [Myxococcota bacterium]|jgi:protein SCO1/2